MRIRLRYALTAGAAVTALAVAAVAVVQHPGPAAVHAAGFTRPPAPAAPSPGAARPGGPFVALGDSYAAGNLIPDSPAGLPLGCLRSTRNYSGDIAYSGGIAAAAGTSGYVDAACSGATTADMTRPQPTAAGTNPPQFGALSAGDSVVTVTIGGNDVGFGAILEECATLSLTGPLGDPCRRHFTAGGTDQLAAAVAATGPKVAAVLRGIRDRAPGARILLVGYPDILPDTGTGCWPAVPLAHGDVPYLRGTEVALNAALAREAAASGATYVGTYTATTGHDACQRPGVKWVEGLVPTSPAYPFHPNQLGQRAMARQVLAALGG